MPKQSSAARRTAAEVAPFAAADLAQRAGALDQADEHGGSLLASGLRLGAMMLMLPLGLALATGGAWQTVLCMGALLSAISLIVAHEDASERRRIEAPDVLTQSRLAPLRR
jgi:hypothetical protein